MRSVMIAMLTAASVLGGCVASDDADEVTAEDSESLIGGARATSNMFASTLMLETGCTAAKVGPRLVLTAAHCVQDVEKNGLMEDFRPNHAIWLTTRNLFDRRRSREANGFRRVVVERTVMHPTWSAEWPNREGVAVVRSPNAPADVAVIVLTPASSRAIATVPSAKIDLAPVLPGDAVTLQGYGCRHGVEVEEGGFTDVLKYARVAIAPKESLLHPGGFFSGPNDPVLANVAGSYAVTPGKRGAPASASLCPGDSGGPLYRTNGRADTIVGVNAYYSFAPESEDPKRVSITNWHTRLDSDARNGVASWLDGLGVATVRTR